MVTFLLALPTDSQHKAIIQPSLVNSNKSYPNYVEPPQFIITEILILQSPQMPVLIWITNTNCSISERTLRMIQTDGEIGQQNPSRSLGYLHSYSTTRETGHHERTKGPKPKDYISGNGSL